MWTKIRYAGIKAEIASTEISDISFIFDHYENFFDGKWNIKIEWDKKEKKHKLVEAGSLIEDFLSRTGVFEKRQTVGNLVKLNKTIGLARAYGKFVKSHDPIQFVTLGADENDIWKIHEHLQGIGYTSDLTALHFMMDIGFQVIKPDIVISRLFLHLGWLHDIVYNLPDDITDDDLVGKGKYKSKFQYTSPKLYKPIIDLTRQILKNNNSDDLKHDIGWSTNNPIREFDIFMVKYGQEPEKKWGLTKNLSRGLGADLAKTSKCPSSTGS
ncbi:hypothetical protein A1507_20030 [Methylomonas koyamae]|uniref:Uncharacterized protein n=2 Tax=Methylomonas koyamae TaxID=702114 RepID=A0A177N168_9GAMM|nr:hypothetical protein A1507_20030 [Methylomonas koyamae]